MNMFSGMKGDALALGDHPPSRKCDCPECRAYFELDDDWTPDSGAAILPPSHIEGIGA